MDATVADQYGSRLFYLPWTDDEDNFQDGVDVSRQISRDSGLPIVAAVTTLSDVPEAFGKVEHITERSNRRGRGPRVVAMLHPTLKLVSQVRPQAGDYRVIADLVDDRLAGWAAFAGAYNVGTGKLMTPGLSDETLATYERLLWNGNNGWADARGKRQAVVDLDQLRERGELKRDLILGYMLQKKNHEAVARLAKLIDNVAR